jgi:hypothetical protein
MAIKYTGPVPPIKQKNSELAQISLKVVQASTNPDQQLLSALWSSPTEKYQIGALDRRTKKFRNIPVNSIDEACQLAKELSEAGSEAYFAMAGYKTSANRQAANVSGASCLWVDIDCGEDKAKSGKGYLTIEDADKAIKQFCATTGMPLPTHIVDSGGGLHAYWALDTFIDRETWLSTAKKLKELANNLSFLADPTRTADPASVLRLPGTLNYKYDPPRTVTLIHSSSELINAKTMLDAIEKAHNLLIKQPAIQQKPVAVQIAKTGGENAGEIVTFQKHPLNQLGGKWKIGRLAALLEHIDPEEGGRPGWIGIGMGLHNVTTGSDEGLDLFDQWSKRGATYPGKRGIEVQWRSFNSSSENRHNIGTIINRVKAAGHDWMDISLADEQFQPCEYQVIDSANLATDSQTAKDNKAINTVSAVIPVGQPSTPKATVICQSIRNALDRFTLYDQLEQIEALAVEQKPILGKFALYGQSTVIYALPNVGKTAIAMSETINGINAGIINPSDLYYINNDDTTAGLAEKLRIANEYGFKMIAETFQNFQASDFLNILDELIENGQARGKIIILDTLTKFVDVLHATQARAFTKYIRKFVLQGGTLIALAHANKNPGTDGKTVYRGTTDIMNDFDCAYVLSQLQANTSEKIVEFENKKRRGNVTKSVAYSYSNESGISYHELLASVKEVDPNTLDQFKQADALRTDAELISVIKTFITGGTNSKMLLADAVAKQAGVSKRSAIKIIERYTGDDPAVHKWSFAVRERGAKVFTLLDNTTPPTSTAT